MAKSTYQAEKAQWESMKSAFIDQAWKAYMRDFGMGKRYAYVKPSSAGVWGILASYSEYDTPGPGFELITAEPIPPADKASIARWLARFADRLPVYPQ